MVEQKQRYWNRYDCHLTISSCQSHLSKLHRWFQRIKCLFVNKLTRCAYINISLKEKDVFFYLKTSNRLLSSIQQYSNINGRFAEYYFTWTTLLSFDLNWPATDGLPSDHQGCPTDGLAGLNCAADVSGHSLAQGRPKAAAVALQLDDHPKVAGVDAIADCVGWFGSAETQNSKLISK